MGCAWCRDDKEELFINQENFKAMSADKKWIAIDCSNGMNAEASYKLHRIENAQFLGADWIVAHPKSIKDAMDKLGVGTDSNVVCYDNDSGLSACIAACFMHASGMKSVRVFEGKFAENKDWKKADKDQVAVAKASGTGSSWNDVPATFYCSNDDMTKVCNGSNVMQVVDMRAKADFEKKDNLFHKDSMNVNLDKVYMLTKHQCVAVGDVDKTIADLKIKRDVATVLVGGGNDAFAMQWAMMAQGFKNVSIYRQAIDGHLKMVKDAADKAAADKKAADDKKKEAPAADKKDAPADDKKTEAPAAADKKDAVAENKDAPATTDAPAAEKKDAPEE